jgi:hypothetical protein
VFFLAGNSAGVASDAAVLVDYETVAHALHPVGNRDAGGVMPWNRDRARSEHRTSDWPLDPVIAMADRLAIERSD